MTKEIKTEKFEGLVVLVPDDATDFRIDYASYVVLSWSNETGSDAFRLDNCRYKILGKATELTEEQCADIMPGEDIGLLGMVFKNYINPSDPFCDAKQSFKSFMHSLECYSVNPYGEKPEFVFGEYGKSPIEFNRFELDMFKWQEAQSNTGTWLILKKL